MGVQTGSADNRGATKKSVVKKIVHYDRDGGVGGHCATSLI